jgi:peptide/nickel transport system substrate-binding protein
MRQHPIGTGPFKFVEFKPNENIKLAKNPDYWKPGRPYLDGIEYTIIPNRSTQILAFIAGKFDVTFPFEQTVQLMKDVQSQAPSAICELDNTMGSVQPDGEPRQAALRQRRYPQGDDADALDRKAFIDIRLGGQRADRRRDAAAAGRPMGSAAGDPADAAGLWTDVEKNRAEARKI